MRDAHTEDDWEGVALISSFQFDRQRYKAPEVESRNIERGARSVSAFKKALKKCLIAEYLEPFLSSRVTDVIFLTTRGRSTLATSVQ